MEEKSKSIKYGGETVQSQLDRVLDRLKDVGEDEKKYKTERRVFAERREDIGREEKVKKMRKPLFKDIGWYLGKIKKWVLVLAGLNILVYILQAFDSLYEIMVNIVEPLLLIVDFIIFGVITTSVKRREKETFWQAIVTVFLAGFFLGFLVSIFKVFWFRQFWTINNLIIEPMFMGLLALAVGLIVGLFIKRKRI